MVAIVHIFAKILIHSNPYTDTQNGASQQLKWEKRKTILRRTILTTETGKRRECYGTLRILTTEMGKTENVFKRIMLTTETGKRRIYIMEHCGF